MSFLIIPSVFSITSASLYYAYNYITTPEINDISPFSKEIELLANKIKEKRKKYIQDKQAFLSEIKKFDRKTLNKIIIIVKNANEFNYELKNTKDTKDTKDTKYSNKLNNYGKKTTIIELPIKHQNPSYYIVNKIFPKQNKKIIQQPKNKKHRKNGN